MSKFIYLISFNLSLLGLILFISFILGGCVSPRNWSHERHVEVMNVCHMMCDEAGVRRYNPLLGTCECHSRSSN